MEGPEGKGEGVPPYDMESRDWLYAAAEALNPRRQPDRHLRPRTLAKLTERLPPPPPSLLQEWLQTEWRLPGEPALLYLARGLARHAHITALAPTLRLRRPDASRGRTPSHWQGDAIRHADHGDDNDDDSDDDEVEEEDGGFLTASSAVRWPGWPFRSCGHVQPRGGRGGGGQPFSRPSTPTTLPLPSSAFNCPARCGVFRVVGIHTGQAYPEFVQTGWEMYLSCGVCCCPYHPRGPPSRVDESVSRGGDAFHGACPQCGGPLRREPTWKPRVHVVLEPWGRLSNAKQGQLLGRKEPTASSPTNMTMSAVVLGSEPVSLMTLGRVVRLLYYHMPVPSTSGNAASSPQSQQMVVHSAVECSAHDALLIQQEHQRAVAWRPIPTTALPLSMEEQYQQQQRDLARYLTFPHACAIFQPNIIGQDMGKRALMLSMLYTLYTQRRVGTDRMKAAPLHTLVVGPPKCGKSSLLRAAWRLFGVSRAEYLTPATVVRRGTGGRAAGSGGGVIDALWPCHSGLVLCGGAALLSECVFLDGAVPSSSSSSSSSSAVGGTQLQLSSLLESGLVEYHGRRAGGSDGGGVWDGTFWHSDVQIIIGAQEGGPDAAGALPTSLLPAIRLIVPLQQGLSLEQSASVGARVMSSVARSSVSQRSSASPQQSSDSPWRSLSQSSSSSSSFSISSASSPFGAMRGHHPMCLSPAATNPGGAEWSLLEGCSSAQPGLPPPPVHAVGAPPRQLSDALLHVAVTECAPELEVVEAALQEAGAALFFYQKLVRHAVLLEQATGSCGGVGAAGAALGPLPPPAFERGNDRPRTVPLSAGVYLTPHLETLHALAIARLLLPETIDPRLGAPPRLVVFTVEMAEEVWEVYIHSLRAAARLMKSDTRRPTPAQDAHRRTSLPGGGWNGAATVTRDPGHKRPRGVSKKKMYLQFVQALAEAQRCAGDAAARRGSPWIAEDGAGAGAGTVCEAEWAREVYERMGGIAVFQESFDVLINTLQHAGMLLRRPGGWKVLMEGLHG